jgi:methionyl aminopeptidase
MARISVRKNVSKAIGKNTRSYMHKRVETCSLRVVVRSRHPLMFRSATGVDTDSRRSTDNYNPWPGFHFTGKLRPYPTVRIASRLGRSVRTAMFFQSARRSIPANIGRPDYADDPRGRSKSEEKEKSSSGVIHVLTDDEQDLLRDICRVSRSNCRESRHD